MKRWLLPLLLLAAFGLVVGHALGGRRASDRFIPGPEDRGAPMRAEKARVRERLLAGDPAGAEAVLKQAAADYHGGRIDDVALRNLYQVFADPDPALAAPLDAWLALNRDSYAAHLARGIYFRSVGEAARGDRYFGDTPPEKIAAMQAQLDRAFSELQASLLLNDRPVISYLYLISAGKHVENREFLRRQLDASLRSDPRNFVVRRVYLRTLRPRWGGSLDAMRAFLKECAGAGLPADQMSELGALVAEEEGWAEEQAGHHDEALRRYSAALGAFPNSNDELWKEAARIAMEGDDCLAALPKLTHLVERGGLQSTDMAWVHGQRGVCLSRTGHPREGAVEQRLANQMSAATHAAP